MNHSDLLLRNFGAAQHVKLPAIPTLQALVKVIEHLVELARTLGGVERLGGLEVYDQPEFGRLLERQVMCR
jgi:hypothetical protein